MGCVLSHYLERVELITHKRKERKEFCRDSFIHKILSIRTEEYICIRVQKE